MAHHASANYEALGSAILERFGEVKVPAFLRPTVAAFADVHRALVKASIAAADARAGRDDALVAIADADDALDVAVMALGDAVIEAKLGSKKNPFDRFSKHAPAKLCALPYGREVSEVRKLVKAIGKKKGAPKQALLATSKLADEVEAALEAFAKPQARAFKAAAAHDALLLDWQKSLGRLRRLSAAAWVDDEKTFQRIFSATPATAHAAPAAKAKSESKRAAKAAPAKKPTAKQAPAKKAPAKKTARAEKAAPVKTAATKPAPAKKTPATKAGATQTLVLPIAPLPSGEEE
jgi:hypothetical protein